MVRKINSPPGISKRLEKALALVKDIQGFLNKYPLLVVLPIFTLSSHVLFSKFYETSLEVIDEEFHLYQARDYCSLKFDRWHPKITTPPGLYILGAILCNAADHCDTYCFRHTSFIASIINLVLFFKILQLRFKSRMVLNMISAINLSLLPPLYFFDHLYYSDVPSLMMILLMMYCYLQNQHILTAISGVCSIFIRQTNIIWVVMFAGQYFFNHIMQHSDRRGTKISTTHIEDFRRMSLRRLFTTMTKTTFKFWCNCFAYGSVVLSFLGFLWYNGGIVLGDKSAHQAEMHIPQLLYFSLFSVVFGLPHLLKQTKLYFKTFSLFHNRRSLFVIFIIFMIIHFNTLEHPYLLADNRHYIFYVWNRYLKYYPIRMGMALVYHFGLFGLIITFYDKTNIWSFLTFVPCLILVLCFQKLIEIRYFIVPFVLWRLQLRSVNIRELIFEFILYIFINALTIKIFFDKEIKWDDRTAVQRMIW